MTTTITEPGLVFDMPDTIYHADPVPGGSLSSTGARHLLDIPARYQYEMTHPRDSQAFSLGRAVHAKVLGAGADIIECLPEHLTPSGNISTKAATIQWLALKRAEGLTALSPSEQETVDALAEAVLAHKGARRLLEEDAESEVSVFGTDPLTGIWVRARFDRLGEHAIDLKTTSGSAGPEAFGRACATYGYPVQEAHYMDALRFTGHEIDTPMRFIVVEKKPPHLVAVHHLTDDTRQVGEELARKARKIYAECSKTGTWPGYSSESTPAIVPNWWICQLDEDVEIEV